MNISGRIRFFVDDISSYFAAGIQEIYFAECERGCGLRGGSDWRDRGVGGHAVSVLSEMSGSSATRLSLTTTNPLIFKHILTRNDTISCVVQ